ncbi:GTP-binding protein [Mangrovactinospora gilvigrisea]|uniref:GTP-binding protein n=1 Tax=Mangrovactinospora gilvigrisea TaxID=1428644 RepID=A0A1J7BCL0_9ACTN|nr:TetM/TetW/TetO/TetS family tetracycline resistance ribosomal protection protein [Mangrovactinospora gilvigrisea]OIV36439.1 GTP-binding protein [Mangrovactinospora gilvigrisea]
MPRTLNLGILAHVDAGKTSLTERLLLHAGVIDTLGRVDAGTTRTDSLELERRRGITIKSAVVSFRLGGAVVNLIDTPGHPDFIAEVERVLGVLDGAVLVVSAVEGVQAQTLVLHRTLARLGIPTLLFVNKTDRRGADPARVREEIRERLGAAVVPMGADGAPRRPEELLEALAEQDDAFLPDYLDRPGLLTPRHRAALADRTRRGLLHPAWQGSAATGAGVAGLAAGIRALLVPGPPDPDGPLSAAVFKVERGPSGERLAYARLFGGTLRLRDRTELGTVTSIRVFEDGGAVRRDAVPAGRIALLGGLGEARIGDVLGGLPPGRRAVQHFPPPTLETAVLAADRSRKGALHTALAQLAEQDPLIDLRQDDLRNELYLSLYGEVQKEVIQATLAEEFGVDAEFRGTTVVHREYLTGSGAAEEVIGTPSNPFLATVGLRVEPGPPGSGVRFRLGVELGSLPSAFMAAIEQTVPAVLEQGLHGWKVDDCTVTLTRSGYWARQSHAHGTFDKSMSSTAGDFRNLVPLVLMDALRRAGTAVHEPVRRFRVDLPADAYGPVLAALVKARAVPEPPEQRGRRTAVEGEVPVAGIERLERALPGLTRGEGVLETGLDGGRVAWWPVAGRPPSRPRTDHNPLNRKVYLLRVVRRT